jgi:hypothetical protein
MYVLRPFEKKIALQTRLATQVEKKIVGLRLNSRTCTYYWLEHDSDKEKKI